MSLNLGLILRESATQNSDKVALAIGDKTLSYATLHGHAQRLAGGLTGLGHKPGEHVALMLPNVPQFTIAYYAAHYAAAPVVPLNVLLRHEEVAYHLKDSEARTLVVWEGFYEQAKAAFDNVASCRNLVIVKADPTDTTAPDGVHNLSALIAGSQPVQQLPATMPDDTAVILYTSGTTGRPKGAELTHFNMFYNAEYAATKLLRMGEDTRALAVLPLFHSFGQTVIQNAVLLSGGRVVLLPRFDAKAAFEAMQNNKVTLFAGVPTMYFALLHYPEASAYDLASLNCCVAGGSAMPVEVMKAFDDKYNVNILEGYGLSETSPIASFNVLDRPKKPGSIGLPIWGVEFQLEAADGSIVTESGEPGEICIRGHNVMKGYYNKPDATAEANKGGWFHSGDIATRDKDGYYSIVDRKKDMIIRGGYNVYPREIEEVLYGHEAVAEAAVIGIEHTSHGEEIKAVLALKGGHKTTAEDIIAYCKEHLAAYKYPRVVEFMDSLPKGPTGKILKRELR